MSLSTPPTSVSAAVRPSRSMVPLSLYWATGIAVGLLYLRSDLTHFAMDLDGGLSSGHGLSMLAALLVTLVTMLAYDRVVFCEGRSLHFPTLFGFAAVNGLCETMLFIASFKVGVAFASLFTTQPIWLFMAGTLTFFVYSGAIHALFWLKILPPHLNKSPEVETIRLVWIAGLVMVSLLWVWLYFGYQDFWPVVALHALFDAGMVYSIRYRLG